MWNDVKYPKVSGDVYSDKYRIRKFSCLFDALPDSEQEFLLAVQLTYENVDNPDIVIAAPLCGVKKPETPWSYELELEPSETLIGMKVVLNVCDVLIKTSLGRVTHCAYSIRLRCGGPDRL